MFDWAIRWSLNNRIAILLLYASLFVGGIIVLGRLAIDVFPEFAPPQVQIQTEAPGFAARDVEALVTRPIETVLQGSPDIDQIRSNSSGGLSRITIVFNWSTEIFRARQIIQERLQLVSGQLPRGVGTPQLMPVTSAVSWLLKFAIVDWGAVPREHELRALVDWDFRNRLLAQPGVASLVAVGGGVKQYQVALDPLRLRKFGISVAEAADAVGNSNLVAPGAFVYPSREEEYFVRANGLVKTLPDLGASVVAIRAGQPVRLDDIADIGFGNEIKRGDGQMLGGPAIIATVSKLWGSDTLETTHRVEAVLRELTATLPKDVQLVPDVFRQANFIEISIDNLKEALIHSSIIVALVLALFLTRWRPTAISLIAIPISLLAGILVLWLLGVGINALTLGGLVFAIGEVVDDAIIDVENILRRLRENRRSGGPRPALEIIYEGSREIRNSIVFATLVILVAFLPVFFLHGIEGRIYRPLAVAYIAAIASSLVVAITLVPVLCYYLIGRQTGEDAYTLNRFSRTLLRSYTNVLQPVISRPLPLVSVCAVALVAALFVVFHLGRSFMPPFHEGNIVIAATLMPGTSLEENLRVGRTVMQAVEAMPEVASIAQRAGRSRLDEDAQPVNFSEFDIALKPSARDVAGVMQAIRTKLAEIPGMSVNVSQFITHRMSEILSGVRAQVVVKIYGQDFDVLSIQQSAVYAAVQGVPGIVDLQIEPMVMVPGIDIRVNREAAAMHGFTPAQIVNQASQAFNGIAVSKVLEQDRTFDIYLRIARQGRSNIETLGTLPLTSPSGAVVPLREIAQLVGVREPYMINRDGGARRAVVAWNVEGRDLNSVVNEAKNRIEKAVALPPGYTVELGGDYVGQQRATADLLLAGGISLVLMVLIIFQAFRHWPTVFLVLANLPMALIGAVFALALAGETLNVSSLIGLIALFGVATRNSILLVSRFQALHHAETSRSLSEIALQGASDRLLPILLTAFTATLAVLPLMLGAPAGKELERPLAIVLLGGMFTSTALNLFVIPSLFVWIGSRFGGATGRAP